MLYKTLNNGLKIPSLGFGTYKSLDQEGYDSVIEALKVGYRHIDTAFYYGNEKLVGQAMIDSGLKREDIFLTTKLWNDDHTYEKAKAAIQLSLDNLQVDYLDLYLIHWPNPVAYRDAWEESNAQSWKAMEEAYEAGLIKAIGVSNFMPHHLDALMKSAKIKPMVNQIYLSPSDQQEDVVAYNNKHQIVSSAWSPLGRGTILSHPPLIELGKKYHKTPSQMVLRWSLQKGFVPLPKSVTPSRIQENFDVFDFAIEDLDIALMDSFSGIGFMAPDPDTKNM